MVNLPLWKEAGEGYREMMLSDTVLDALRQVLLIIHIVAGTVGLVVAGPVLLVSKRRGVHTTLGRVYGLAVLLLCLTAFPLVAYNPDELWWLGLIGVGTLSSAAGGIWLVRERPRVPRGWYVWHLNLMCGSVISFVTAFAVQITDGHPLSWIIPTIVGSPLIAIRSAMAQGADPFRRFRLRRQSVT